MASMDYEQSLDDIIKADKSSGRGGRGGRGGARGRGGRSSRGRGGRGGDSAGRTSRPTSSGGAGAKALKAALSAATTATRGGRGGGGGRASRGRGRGGRGRGVIAGKVQPTVVPAGRWKHDMFSGARAKRGQMYRTNNEDTGRRRLAPAGPKIMNLKPKKIAKAAPLTTGTVLRVTNLDDGVTASDMKELFESEGTLKKVVMTATHCDVTFQVKEEAVQAMHKFNGVTLDGEQMKIKLMSSLGSVGRDVRFTVTL